MKKQYTDTYPKKQEMKKLYLVRHNTEDKLHCYAIRADSFNEALRNAKLYIGDKSLLNKDPTNFDNFIVVEEIDSITLMSETKIKSWITTIL